MGKFEETIERIQERIILNEKLKGMEGNIIGVSVEDVNIILQELENTKADLYEANRRIADLLLILGDRDRMINKMSEQLTTPIHDKEWVIKYYEKESKNAKD